MLLLLHVLLILLGSLHRLLEGLLIVAIQTLIEIELVQRLIVLLEGGENVAAEEDLVEGVELGVIEVAVEAVVLVAVVILVVLVVLIVRQDVQLVLLVLNDGTGLCSRVLIGLLGLLLLLLPHNNRLLAEEHQRLHDVLLVVLDRAGQLAGVSLDEGAQPDHEALDLEVLLDLRLYLVVYQLEEALGASHLLQAGEGLRGVVPNAHGYALGEHALVIGGLRLT